MEVRGSFEPGTVAQTRERRGMIETGREPVFAADLRARVCTCRGHEDRWHPAPLVETAVTATLEREDGAVKISSRQAFGSVHYGIVYGSTELLIELAFTVPGEYLSGLFSTRI